MDNMKKAANKRQVILMITDFCNLNCAYCYEQKKGHSFMKRDVATYILQQEIKGLKGDTRTQKIEFAYLGGEPLLNFSLIRTLSEWIWQQEIPVPYELTVRTNGTLLTKEMKDWFAKNREHIQVGLSMDGFSTMNRLNRTDDRINWQFFQHNWPKNRVRIVLFKDTVHLLAETVREMNKANLCFEIVIGEGFFWDSESAGILERELLSLVEDYLEKPKEGKENGLFSFQIGDYFTDYPMKEVMFCGETNKNIIAYDTDGSPCICHMFSTPTIGAEKARWSWINLQKVKKLPFDPVCRKCPVHKNCKSCFGINMSLYGDIYRSAARKTICKAIKAKARAGAFFYLKRMERRIEQQKTLTPEEVLYANKAVHILEKLSY